MISLTPEAFILWSVVLAAWVGYVGWAAGQYVATKRHQAQLAVLVQRVEAEARDHDRTLESVAAWAKGDWWCAEHLPANGPGVVNVSPWSEVAPEQCAAEDCEVEMLALAQHRLAAEELPLALERFTELPPVAQDRVRALLDRINTGEVVINGCVVCGEVDCDEEHFDSIEVAHEFDDHSRCSIWCSERLGAVELH